MAIAVLHASHKRLMENIAAAAEAEREAMEEAEAETRMATRRWRQFTKWLQIDSNARKLPKANFSRRLAKAKLVWWARKKNGDWRRDIDQVIADRGGPELPIRGNSRSRPRSRSRSRSHSGGIPHVDLTC